VIELHHFGFSTCSQKLRLVLAEKGVEFSSREINLMAGEQHDPEYVKLNPKHVVPTLVHAGRVFVESSLKTLPCYAVAVDVWIVPAAVEMMRTNGKEAWPAVEPLTRSAAAWASTTRPG
jgi:hypothetical protein